MLVVVEMQGMWNAHKVSLEYWVQNRALQWLER